MEREKQKAKERRKKEKPLQTCSSVNHEFHLRIAASARSPHKEPSVPPNTGNFSEEWARGLCSSPLDSRLYINSWGDRCSSEHCLLFVCFFPPPLSLSCLCCGERGRQKHYSCPCWVSRAVLSPCVSWSLARPSTRPLYFLVVSLNRPFYQQALCPPKTLLSIGCSISWGIIPIR